MIEIGDFVMHKRSKFRYKILAVHRSGSQIYGCTARKIVRKGSPGGVVLRQFGPSRYLAIENIVEFGEAR